MGVIRNILNSRLSKDGDFFMRLQDMLGFAPKNLNYYHRAFTHRSLQKVDNFGKPFNYERLEFLGDAVLDAVVAAYLYNELPEADEGYLTQMRSKIVSRQSLNKLGEDFGLIQLLKFDGPQDQLGENIYGNLFEALVGAIYKDRGYRYCKKFFRKKIVESYVDINRLEGKIMSYKSHMIEWCQKEKQSFKFENQEDTGQESVKHFSVSLKIAGEVVAKARSTSKKKAEEKAAKRAYYALRSKIEG